VKHSKAYYTNTSKIIQQMQLSKNPVTRAVYRDILGNRIDRLELDRLNRVDTNADQ